MQVCDGTNDCPQTETSEGRGDEDNCREVEGGKGGEGGECGEGGFPRAESAEKAGRS